MKMPNKSFKLTRRENAPLNLSGRYVTNPEETHGFHSNH